MFVPDIRTLNDLAAIKVNPNSRSNNRCLYFQRMLTQAYCITLHMTDVIYFMSIKMYAFQLLMQFE